MVRSTSDKQPDQSSCSTYIKGKHAGIGLTELLMLMEVKHEREKTVR